MQLSCSVVEMPAKYQSELNFLNLLPIHTVYKHLNKFVVALDPNMFPTTDCCSTKYDISSYSELGCPILTQ